MDCFYCTYRVEAEDPLEHLARQHADQVDVAADRVTARVQLRIACPYCPFTLRTEFRPTDIDAMLADENSIEVGLVAFNLLLFHLTQDHDPGLNGERLIERRDFHPTG